MRASLLPDDSTTLFKSWFDICRLCSLTVLDDLVAHAKRRGLSSPWRLAVHFIRLGLS